MCVCVCVCVYIKKFLILLYKKILTLFEKIAYSDDFYNIILIISFKENFIIKQKTKQLNNKRKKGYTKPPPKKKKKNKAWFSRLIRA